MRPSSPIYCTLHINQSDLGAVVACPPYNAAQVFRI